MKYIDSEKLIAYIERRKEKYRNTFLIQNPIKVAELDDLLNVISSLQQDHIADASKMVESEHIADVSKMMEQAKSTCKTCGFYENNCPFIRGKLIPYPNNVCKDYIHSAMKEKPEVELEKEIDDYLYSIERWQVEDEPYSQLAKCARHFYELGLNAGKQ